MPTFGFTDEGLKIKRLADILEDMQNDARTTFGNAVDLDSRRPLGQFIGITAERMALIWELVEQLNNANSPRHASGKQLDEIVTFNGLIRRQATFSTVPIEVTGDEGVVVNSGSQVSVDGDPEAIFEVDEDITILAGTDEVQRITFLSQPMAGAFTLNLDGLVTTPLAFDTDAQAVEDALNGLSTLSDVEVTGSTSAGFVITFAGDDGQRPWPLLQIGSNTLTSQTVHRVTLSGTAAAADAKGFRFDDGDGPVGVYFDIDDIGDSVPAGLDAVTDRAIRIATIDTGDSNAVMATKLAAELALDPAIDTAVVVSSTTVEFKMIEDAPLQNLVDLDTGFTFATPNIGRDIGGLTITPVHLTPGVLPTGEGTATALTAGEVLAPTGSLTVIESNITGWTGVTNTEDAEVGRPVERDDELKARRIEQFAKAGRAVPNAIKAKLLDVPGVESAAVRFNNKSTTENGLPPKSVKAYVLGGEDEDIAAMLYDTVAAGIETVGDVEVEYIDADGYPHDMFFSRPTLVPIYVAITIKKNAGDTWPATISNEIKAAVLEYGETLTMGDDVIPYPKLMSYLNLYPNIVQDMSLSIGLTASPTNDARLAIAAESLAVFDTARITVTLQNL